MEYGHLGLAYAAGVLVGLWRTDASPPSRMVYAVLWPIGPLACVVTLTGLVLVVAVASGARALHRGEP